MRQAATALADFAIIAVSIGLAFARKTDRDHVDFAPPRFAPIETFVDWLEASYGGPIGPDQRA
jgi:hypothetical protein